MRACTIPNSTYYDFNALVSDGVYASAPAGSDAMSIQNAPSSLTSSFFSLEVTSVEFDTSYSTSSPIKQVRQVFVGPDGMFVRVLDVKGTWHAWAKIA